MKTIDSFFKFSFAGAIVAAGLVACGGSDTAPAVVGLDAPSVSFTKPQSSFDLANYTQTGRYSLPVGAGLDLLAEEASGITYNKDTDTLFIVGDGSTSVVQVTKKGELIDSMMLAKDVSKPQGTYFL